MNRSRLLSCVHMKLLAEIKGSGAPRASVPMGACGCGPHLDKNTTDERTPKTPCPFGPGCITVRPKITNKGTNGQIGQPGRPGVVFGEYTQFLGQKFRNFKNSGPGACYNGRFSQFCHFRVLTPESSGRIPQRTYVFKNVFG